jgi:endonuclease/exonuclease/phosphatase family metal-dependent hydrolase
MIKKLLFFSIMVFSFISAQSKSPMIVMTYNIRLDLASDGENRWDKRKSNFTSMIRYHKADVIGLQEALRHQIDDIIKDLPEYEWCGIGRDDGKNAGEFMAILYRKERFDLIRTSTFWCSPTPNMPGLGWDAAYNRTVTWGKFLDKKNKNAFFLFNTHLDNEGNQARREGAKLLLDSIVSITGKEPVIITGDFNSTPEDEPYQIITGKSSKKNFFDTRLVSTEKPHGPHGTFNGFNFTTDSLVLMDYIFINGGNSVFSHGTLSESFNGRFPSDHFPVAAEIVIGTQK